nr:hypothetical protein [Tanacetum cinerariifolium]
MGFMVYQMDVKSAFLYGTIEEEAYVCQHLGFENPDYPNKANEGFLVGYYVNSKAFRVFNSRTKIVQETLHINFLENKPNVAGIGPKCSQDPQNTDANVADATFDVKENENEVHVSPNGSDTTDNKKHNDKAKRDDKGKSHVDTPIGVKDLRAGFEEFSFNSTNRVNAVSAPVNAGVPNSTNSTNSFNNASPSINVQKDDGIFISQDKYVAEILRKFGFTDVKSASTPIETEKPLLKDSDGEDVDVHIYRSMIGSLMYLTSSRTNIMFAVYACARFQVTPKVSHLHAVKRIFSFGVDAAKELGIC